MNTDSLRRDAKAAHRFPRGAVLYHGTSCSRARDILKHGFRPDTFFTTSKHVAKQYACRRGGERKDAKGACMLKLVCSPGSLLWYHSRRGADWSAMRLGGFSGDPSGKEVNNFFSGTAIPAYCAKLAGRPKCGRFD